MDKLLAALKKDFPKVHFKEGPDFCWSPKNQAIFYNNRVASSRIAPWALLHEAGHASLEHQTYHSDLELVELEAKAWDAAQKLGHKYAIEIDPDHIQDCIDTYRDWLHQRSACPNCNSRSFQQTPTTYRCHNCGQHWSVSTSRFCRPYRLKIDANKKSPLEKSQRATFV
jgi:hypothetical protein